MTSHEKFVSRAQDLVQIATSFNDDCISTFDLEALRYFYEQMNELIGTVHQSLRKVNFA